MSDVVMRLLIRAAYVWACATDDQRVGEQLEALVNPKRAIALDTDDNDGMGDCPNCQTPWKCNGPHTPGGTSAAGSSNRKATP